MKKTRSTRSQFQSGDTKMTYLIHQEHKRLLHWFLVLITNTKQWLRPQGSCTRRSV